MSAGWILFVGGIFILGHAGTGLVMGEGSAVLLPTVSMLMLVGWLALLAALGVGS